MKTKVALIFSGCGVYDGSEISESVLTMLALAKADADVTYLAPDIAQKHVINHTTGEAMEDETRNVRVEAARITRGQMLSLDQVQAEDFDAFIYVGGFGAAKNLSSYAFDGIEYDADPGVVDLIQAAHKAGRPQGFMCISPVLAAKALGPSGIVLTIGNDPDTAKALESKGATHQECPVDTIITDQANRVVSTPGFMLGESILDIEPGIQRLVEAVLQLVKQR